MLDLDAELEEYIGLHSEPEPEPEILQQLSRATHQKILRPRQHPGS